MGKHIKVTEHLTFEGEGGRNKKSEEAPLFFTMICFIIAIITLMGFGAVLHDIFSKNNASEQQTQEIESSS